MFGLDSDRQLLIGATEAGGATGSYSRWRFRYSSTEAVRDEVDQEFAAEWSCESHDTRRGQSE